jgi:hypothetical protein
VDTLSVQEMALIYFDKLYNIENLLYSIIALLHLFIKINWLFRQWGMSYGSEFFFFLGGGGGGGWLCCY